MGEEIVMQNTIRSWWRNQIADKQPLLRSQDVAHILDCSPDDVIELARTKELKGIKKRRSWRFHRRDVQAYKRRLEEQEAAKRISVFA